VAADVDVEAARGRGHLHVEGLAAAAAERSADPPGDLGRVGIEALVGPLLDAHGTGRRRITLHVRASDGGPQGRGHLHVEGLAAAAAERSADPPGDLGRAVQGGFRDRANAHGTGRRRITLHVRASDGGPQAGFMAARSHALVLHAA
jgi:hypothetical protein